jgi:hypothetical protein
MKKTYTFEYVDETNFCKLEKSLKKYNMLAYKKLIFDYYPSLKEGKFLGELISKNAKENSVTYELKLPTDSLFAKVHGTVKLHYIVYEEQGIILLDTFTPKEILSEGHQSELTTYKGVMVSNANSCKDMFKINLLSMLE